LKQIVLQHLFLGIVCQTNEFLFLEIPEFSFRDQLCLKSAQIHLKIHREEIKVGTEILIKGYPLVKTNKMLNNIIDPSTVIGSLKISSVISKKMFEIECLGFGLFASLSVP